MSLAATLVWVLEHVHLHQVAEDVVPTGVLHWVVQECMQTCKLTQSYSRCWERLPISLSPIVSSFTATAPTSLRAEWVSHWPVTNKCRFRLGS